GSFCGSAPAAHRPRSPLAAVLDAKLRFFGVWWRSLSVNQLSIARSSQRSASRYLRTGLYLRFWARQSTASRTGSQAISLGNCSHQCQSSRRRLDDFGPQSVLLNVITKRHERLELAANRSRDRNG